MVINIEIEKLAVVLYIYLFENGSKINKSYKSLCHLRIIRAYKEEKEKFHSADLSKQIYLEVMACDIMPEHMIGR